MLNKVESQRVGFAYRAKRDLYIFIPIPIRMGRAEGGFAVKQGLNA